MTKQIAFLLLPFLLLFSRLQPALVQTPSVQTEEIGGFWTTINAKTEKPSSLIAVYCYEGKWYGRIIATYNSEGVIDDTVYNPKARAPGIEGNPYYSGLDILWNVKRNKNGSYKGFITDPEKGKTYEAKVRRSGDNLILRGEVLIFGRDVVWPPFDEGRFTTLFPKPDVSTFVPVIPRTGG